MVFVNKLQYLHNGMSNFVQILQGDVDLASIPKYLTQLNTSTQTKMEICK